MENTDTELNTVNSNRPNHDNTQEIQLDFWINFDVVRNELKANNFVTAWSMYEKSNV